jgi:hypothetical protein
MIVYLKRDNDAFELVRTREQASVNLMNLFWTCTSLYKQKRSESTESAKATMHD